MMPLSPRIGAHRDGAGRDFEKDHPWNPSNTQKASWGTIGTLPTPPQIEMGHPWNTSNTPSD